MDDLVDLVDALAWPVLVLALVLLLRRPIADVVLPRLTGVKAFGVALAFAEQALERAAEERNVPTQALEAARERLRSEASVLVGARILWVDDNPRGNFDERRLFERAGATVDPALSTTEALDLVDRNPYDVVITDWSRGNDPNAGPDLVEKLHGSHVETPVVLYPLVVKGRDRGRAFALTNRPDELVVDVLDAVRRSASLGRRARHGP